MDGLKESVGFATEELSVLEKSRETAIACSRRVIRLTKMLIHDIHIRADSEDDLDKLESEMENLRSVCGDSFILSSGPVQDAMGEYAEAVIFHSVMNGMPIPDHRSLRITASAWVLGLADSEGELRRAVMTRLMDGDLDDAKEIFSAMESIHEQVMLLDVPDAVAPVRRKQDIARGIMDKTRSDITTASIMKR